MARPKLKLDERQIRALARINCTMIEIAAVMGCSVDTLERRYADTIKTERASGRASLRREQWRKAMSGNVTMQIWLGKNELGQTDRADITTRGESVNDLRISVVPKRQVDLSRIRGLQLDEDDNEWSGNGRSTKGNGTRGRQTRE